jgi:integrase
MGEVDSLARLCRVPLEVIEQQMLAKAARNTGPSAPVVSLEVHRARSTKLTEEVGGESAAIRIRYIGQYLRWLLERKLLDLPPQHPTFVGLTEVKNIVLKTLYARVPSAKGRNCESKRTALSEETQERLWQVIDADSVDNPWTGEHIRVRNALIVRWFMGLGIRRGELLGVDIAKINFRTNEVFIARRADDKSDPRLYQPNTKTSDRILPFSDDLAKRTLSYIVNFRRKFPLARRHPFLFVANGGRPLSLNALNKIFTVLRSRCPDLPDDVIPHVLRYTWNDNFSKSMDATNTSPEHEQKMRSRLMGWKPTSNTAMTYNRRHIERRARKASLEMQEKMVKPKNGV